MSTSGKDLADVNRENSNAAVWLLVACMHNVASEIIEALIGPNAS